MASPFVCLNPSSRIIPPHAIPPRSWTAHRLRRPNPARSAAGMTQAPRSKQQISGAHQHALHMITIQETHAQVNAPALKPALAYSATSENRTLKWMTHSLTQGSLALNAELNSCTAFQTFHVDLNGVFLFARGSVGGYVGHKHRLLWVLSITTALFLCCHQVLGMIHNDTPAHLLML
eukprot:4863454-Amphidinium_carterae.1